LYQLSTQQKQIKAEAIPDLNLSTGVVHNNSENSNAINFGISMNLPLLNKNLAAQRKIEFQQKALREKRANIKRLFDAEVNALRGKLLIVDSKILSLKTNTIPKAESLYSILKDNYSNGSASFLDLGLAQSENVRLRIDLLLLEAERAQSLVELMQITSSKIQLIK
jgi:outer membrane protein, heavy metal efflux system